MQMEIPFEKINIRNEPYQLFLDSIRSQVTARKYKNALYTFLKLIIPNQLYINSLGKTPTSRTPQILKYYCITMILILE